MRVVLDSTILVSAFFTPLGVSDEILTFARKRAFQICLSLPILLEVERVLLTTKRRQRHPYPDEEVTRYLNVLGMVAEIVMDPPPIVDVVRDPNDDMVIACAVGSNAELVVSRDKDLLSIERYGKIDILTPEAFIGVLRARYEQ